jgi:acetolactate synthase-1/2/3 large subunit
MRFDDRITGRIKDFANKARIIHIDIDPAEIGKVVKTAVPIVGDVKQVLGALAEQVATKRHDDWRAWIAEVRREHPSITIRDTDKLLPQFVIKKIYELTGSEAYYVTGVGQHQMWAAQHFWSDRPNSFVTSGGLGTMGFELPAAVGTQFARPNDLVWSIAGNGGFQMTVQELATVVEYELPIKFAIINNSYLGMVRQWQELFYKNNLQSVYLYQPDFVKLAEAYGATGLRVTDKVQVEPAIEQALRHHGPFVIDFQVEEKESIFPMVPGGASLAETIDLPTYEEAERVRV